MQTFISRFKHLALFLLTANALSVLAQTSPAGNTQGRKQVPGQTSGQVPGHGSEQVSGHGSGQVPGQTSGQVAGPANTKSTGNENTDSIRVEPPLKSQVKDGIHQLGTDIHDAFSTLKTQIKEANKTGKSIFDNSVTERDSTVGLDPISGASVDSENNEIRNEKTSVTGKGILEKHKQLSKSYTVTTTNRLDINNKYGSIKVLSWDKPEMKVDIHIQVEGRSADNLRDLLNQITIQETRDAGQISLNTHYGDQIDSTWKNFTGKNKNIRYEVNYLIYMPRKRALSISARYGNITLPDNITVVN